MLDSARLAATLHAGNLILYHTEDRTLETLPCQDMGQKDQVAALNWVHQIIQLYGGDAPRITVAGQSAGGYINSNLAN